MSAPVSRPPHVILAALACLCAPWQLLAQVTTSCAGVNVTTQRAVYVSPTGTDNAGCGATAAAACKTIQQGIGNCSGAGCGVLIRHGFYRVAAPVTLAGGMSVYGSCSFDSSRIPYRTIVAGPSPVIAANQITSPTTIHGLVVNADDTTNPGQASTAMAVSNSSALTFSHNVLASGKGAPGQPGAYADGGPGGGGSYPNGNSGGPGGPACPSNRVSSDGDGGQGADYQQIFSNNCVGWCLTCDNVNYPNYLGQAGHFSGTVPGGGGGGPGSPGCACQHGDAGDGAPGVAGSPGACGAQGGQLSTNGGPSFGIALVAGSPASSVAGVRIYPANPGAPGSGAAGGQNTSSQCQGSHGYDGQAGFANNNNSVVTY